MAVRVDPEGNEARALFDLVDFRERHVLGIGSGDGRLTRHYAAMAAHVTALEPFQDSLRKAVATLPDALRDRIDFHNMPYAASLPELSAYYEEANAFDDSAGDQAFVAWAAQLAPVVEAAWRAAGDGAEVVYRERAHIARLVPLR
jgi:SAM-dependent methyltransferase